MSGDVQPRKRKDKKRKKDELGVEEPRGTSATLGEGDVFLHSHHEHGTGGHWCAKIIFFSLLAVLVTLIGLIILENRGLTELEANSVESRYSGVLEGWLEDAPDDDHHDEHTLELKHHGDEQADHDDKEVEERDDDDNEDGEIDDQDDDDEHGDEDDQDDVDDEENEDIHDQDDDDEDEDHGEVDDHDDDDNNDDDEEQGEGDDQDDDDDDVDDGEEQYEQEDYNSKEQSLEEVDEGSDNEERDYRKYDESSEDDDNDKEDVNTKDDLLRVDENDSAEGDDDDVANYQEDEAQEQSVENYGGEENSNEDEQDDSETRENEDDGEHEDEIEEDSSVLVERLEKEVTDEDALLEEQPLVDSEEDDKSEEIANEIAPDDEDTVDEVAEDDEFLEADDIEEELPIVEHIVAPKGKPLVEVEDETSTMKPADTLADEEEYEKRQEELRREREEASHMWLKLFVGGALLVATHAVVRRFTAPRDNDTPASDEHAYREETPVIDRRLTLIPEEIAAAAVPIQVNAEHVQPVIKKQVLENVSSPIKYDALIKDESEEEEDQEEENEDEVIIEPKDLTAEEPVIELDTENKELYSDEEEAEDEEEEIMVEERKEAPKLTAPTVQRTIEPAPEPNEDIPDDVEIIDEEQLEELEEEEDDEEEISDVDDAELLSRLEAKYGRLPEPERPGSKPKDGGNSIEDDWPGEPSDQYWRQQLDQAEEELRQGAWSAASERTAAEQLKGSARARWVLARATDASAEARRDNRLLTRAITSYLDVLKMNERLSNVRLLEVAERTLDRIRFRGNYLSAEPVYRLLIRRFPDVPEYHNNLTVSFLMANRADLAEQVIKETLQKWPKDRVALAHYGFILKTQHNHLEEAVEAFQEALKGDVGPATEPRFYYHLGDALLLLGRFAEAHEVHKRGAALGHFLSPAQRSLYNVERLKSQPWWDIDKTPYSKLARALEQSWKDILKEGEAARALYEKEKEGLKERGEWSQLDLFVRGQEIPNRCKTAPVTCSIVRSEVAAAGCRRGQIKFSSMEAGTHVRPHVGPTNCRLRMHLGLSNTKDTYIRVDQETRQWQVGKTFMFDDSFEHEVWHNGTGTRLVLIVDVWHPALSPAERRTLPPI